MSEAAFAEIAESLLGQPGIDEGTGFGSNPGLRVGGHIFAMLVRGDLVVKLPAARCSELVAAGTAQPFVIGSRTMREWAAIGEEAGGEWRPLVHEALDFVGGGS